MRRWRIKMFGELQVTNGERIVSLRPKDALLLARLAYPPQKAHFRETLIDWLWQDLSKEAGLNNLSTSLSRIRSALKLPDVDIKYILTADTNKNATVQLNPQTIETDVGEFEAILRRAKRGWAGLEVDVLSEALELYKGEFLTGFDDEWVDYTRRVLSADFERATTQLVAHFESTGQYDRAILFALRLIAVDPTNQEMGVKLIRLYIDQHDIDEALLQYRLLRENVERAGEEVVPELDSLGDWLRKHKPSPKPPHKPPPVPPRAPHDSKYTGYLPLLQTRIEHRMPPSDHDLYMAVLTRHNTLLREAFAEHNGQIASASSEGFQVVFPTIAKALDCSRLGQEKIAQGEWPSGITPPRVRMALHAGEVQWDENGVCGYASYYVKCLCDAANGGQILCSAPTEELIRNTTGLKVDLKDLGLYRLNELLEIQRMYALHWAEIPYFDFLPPNAPSGESDRLLPTSTRFVGRERELDELKTLLLPTSRCRLLTLTGLGGIGKTRLAREVAHLLFGPMEGAVWYVPLADAIDLSGVLDALYTHLNLPSRIKKDGTNALNSLVELLGRRPSLLVLDNFEQLLYGNSTEPEAKRESNSHQPHDPVGLVSALLARVPTLTILATSRHLLRLSQEREYCVPPLQTLHLMRPDVKWNIWTLDRCESVRLFVECAQAVNRDFQLTPENGATILEICNYLECIPLAIELAAARVRIATPAEILKQLGDRFQLLKIRNPDIPARHCSMQAALSTSFEILTPSLRQFLAKLSIFRGGWNWKAAVAVCQGIDGYILDLLEELRACSLIQTVELQGEIQFRMLETVREYAEQQLETPFSATERDLLQQAHYTYFLEMAEHSEKALAGPEQTKWLNQLDSEHDNLRAALRRQNSSELRLRLAGALIRFWNRRAHFQEGLSWLESAADASDVSASVRAKALGGAGIMADRLGNFRVARAFLEQSLDLYVALDQQDGIAKTSNNLGMVLSSQGHYQEAQSYYQEAVRIWEGTDNRADLASVLNNLGITEQHLGNLDGAEECFNRSLLLSREVQDRITEGSVLLGLGGILSDQERFAEARNHLEQSLKIFRELDRKINIAIALVNLNDLVYKQDGYPAAWPLLIQSLQIRDAIDDRRGIPYVLEEMADMLKSEQHYVDAVLLLGAATALRNTFDTQAPAARDCQLQEIKQMLTTMLGAETFQKVWRQGLDMSREETISYAYSLNRD